MRRLSLAAVAASVVNVVVPKRAHVVLYSRPYCDDAVRQLLSRLGARFDCYVVHDEGAAPDPAAALALGARAVLRRGSLVAAWRFMRARHVFMTHELFPWAVPRRQVVVNL